MPQNRSLEWEDKGPNEPLAQGNNFLLAIGIDAYHNCPVLKNAVRDATDLAATLEEKYGFHPDHIQVITNEEATEFRIFAEFRKLIQQVGPTDNVLIFFSGHGHYDEDFKQGYWVPVDARAGAIGDYIPNSEISTTIRAIPSRHTFMIADACFSGSLFGESRSVISKETASIYHRKVGAITSRWGLASGRNEIVSDGAPGENSPFTENLIYYLRSQARAPFTVSELVQYVKAATANNSEQTPIGSPLRNVGDKGGEYVFYPVGTEPAPVANARTPSVSLPYVAPPPRLSDQPLHWSTQVLNWTKAHAVALAFILLGTLFWGFWSDKLYFVYPALTLTLLIVNTVFKLKGKVKTFFTVGLTLIVVAEFILYDREKMFGGGFWERTQNHEFLWFSLGLACFVGLLYVLFTKKGANA